MVETYISFYLKPHRIHIFVDALRSLGCPRFIRFMISEDGSTLVMQPYTKKDFHSHRVPRGVYDGSRSMELCSLPLCEIIAAMYHWEEDCSYRVPGYIIPKQKIGMFYLRQAELIEHDYDF